VLEEEHGEFASAWIAKQIVEFIRTGNHEAAERMRVINDRLMQLRHEASEDVVPQRCASKPC
jgi:hypothetical protein